MIDRNAICQARWRAFLADKSANRRAFWRGEDTPARIVYPAPTNPKIVGMVDEGVFPVPREEEP